MERNGHVTLKGYRLFRSERKAIFFLSYGQDLSNTMQHEKKTEFILVWIFSTVVKTWDTRFSGTVLSLLKIKLHIWEKGEL